MKKSYHLDIEVAMSMQDTCRKHFDSTIMALQPFPICTQKYTEILLEECGQAYDPLRAAFEGIRCCECRTSSSMIVFPPSSSNPAWFYCWQCKFSGDLVDYVLRSRCWPESEAVRIVCPDEKLASSKPGEDYFRRRKSRLFAEEYWGRLTDSRLRSYNDERPQELTDLLSWHQDGWNRLYQGHAAFGQSLTSSWLTRLEKEQHDQAKLASQLNLSYLKKSLVFRVESLPGRIEGFKFLRIRQDKLKESLRWLPSSSRVGFCFLPTIMPSHKVFQNTPQMVSTDLISALRYIKEVGREWIHRPRMAVFTCQSMTKIEVVKKSIARLLEIADYPRKCKAIVLGATPDFDRNFARAIGHPYSSFMIPQHVEFMASIWHGDILKSIVAQSAVGIQPKPPLRLSILAQ